ncbi:DUF1702 family protein [Gloeobacter morelensis]|uniref:DUF1702 family protein n=1 Tax=Gloeobacter morelensis MG652769 TaxID=2781736 RepID=A0ABY3PRM5_9CYAN|nr:DUF1702 family protein [Gloeobacter morelensis]UFP96315.1 DUF1702 family protein [Gloeobacter morelensis MG652769]
MVSASGWIRKSLFGLSAQEADFAFRGFRGGDPATRRRIEQVIATFVRAYNHGLEDPSDAVLRGCLEGMDQEGRGFAYEAAAMALALLDHLTPWNRGRFHHYLNGPDDAHTYRGIAGPHRYMAYIGAGLAIARLGRPVEPTLRKLDPFFCWLAMDGYGFHQGFFQFKRYIDRQELPEGFTGYTRRAFDQGVGRSLWFVEGADVQRLPKAIAAFDQSRRADLWSGVGLACAYAGGVPVAAIGALALYAGDYLPHFAQGVAFAAMTRHQALNPAAHTELACQAVWGMPLAKVGNLAARAMDGIPTDRDGYEATRRSIQHQFAWEGATP